MEAAYWTRLAPPFRQFVLTVAEPAAIHEAETMWVDAVIKVGRATFNEAADAVGDRGADLRRRVQAIQACSLRLAKRRKEWLS